MNWKSLFGTASVVLAAWFALGVSATAYADATFDGCTLYSRVKVGNGGATTTCAPINTGFMPSGTTSIDAKYRMHNVSVNSCLFCARTATDMSSGGPHFNFFPVVSGKPRWDYNSTSPVGASNTTVNPNYRLIVESGKATLYTTLDRVLMEMSVASSTFAAKFPMFLFASYTGTTPGDFNNCGQYYFFYFKIYDGPIANGRLQHHYVPCKTSEGKVGVADLVEEKVLLPSQNQSLLVVDENDSLGPVRPMIDASAFSAFATFTASGYEGSEELEEFPALVRLAENSPVGFSYDDCSADGSDIRFADAEGHLIAHEIDTWDPAGESLIWVNVPKLTAETQFRMYIGGDGSAPTLPSSSVWRRAGYHLVNHNNVTATTAGMDSTGSGLTGAAHNGGLVVADLEGAPMGKVDNQTGNHGWNIANDAKWSAHGGQVTISTWPYRTDVTDTTNRELMGVKGAYHLVNQTPKDGKCQLYYGSTSLVNAVMPVAAGNWMQITATLNGTEAKAYQNGVLLGTGTSTAITDMTEKLACGSEYSGNSRNKGYFDEWRLRWGVSSEDWVKAEYDTVMKSDFLEGVMGASDVPVPEDWEYSFAITLSAGMKSALGSGEEVNFPVLVRLSEAGISGFKYSDFKEADYSDLIFVDKDGKFLDYEVDTWDASGVSLVWVRVPSMVASTTITCRYGGPKYKHNEAKTWAGYIGVWHMNEASGNAVDAAGHGLDGVPTGFNTALMVGETTAPTGKGRVNQTATGADTGASNRLSIPSYNSFITDHSKFTLSGWFKSTDKTGYPRPLSRKNAYNDGTGWEVQYDNGSATSVSVRGSDGNGVVTMNGPDSTADWFSLAFVFDGTSETSYGNGGETTQSGTVVAVKTRNEPMAIGNNSNGSERGWCGMYDEVRLYNGVMSAARVKADYLVIKKSDALAYAAVVAPDPELPKLEDCEAVANDAGDIIVSGMVSRHAGEVTVTLSAEGELPIVVSLGEKDAGEEFERELGEADGLIRFIEYTVSVSVSNGEKVAQKTLRDPVRYGKVQPGDKYEFTVTPSVAVRERLGSGSCADYPALVRVPSEALQLMATGREIKVTDESGTELSWEPEAIDEDGLALWVKVPAFTASTKLTVCTGGDGNPNNDPAEVWSAYVGVWHLDEAKATTTPNSHGEYTNSTSTVGINGNLAQYSIPDEPGIVGKSFRVNDVISAKSGNYNYGGVWVPGTSDLKLGHNFTISGWFKMAATAFNYDHIFYKRLKSDNSGSPNGSFAIEVGASSGGSLIVDARGSSSGSSKLNSSVSAFDDWVYLSFVYDDAKCGVYVNGVKLGDSAIAAVTDNDAALVFGNNCNIAAGGSGDCAWCGWIDEVRLASGSRTAEEIAMDYQVVTDAGFFEYGEPHLIDPYAPELSAPEIVANGDGTFTVTEVIDGNMPAEGSVEIVYGDARIPMTTDDTAVPATYTAVLTPETEDVTGIFEIRARSTSRIRYAVGSSGFYNGELKIEKIKDASEKGLSDGSWRITRADTAYDLNVSLVKLDTTTATAGVDYIEFPLNAVISNGMSYADVSVTPLMNLALEEDTWIDLAITNGAYRIDPAGSAARLAIVNYDVPVDANFWTGQTSSKASVGSNWTLGVVPDESSAVVFDGDISKADCEWDADAPHKVKSWMQKENYTGTVTFTTQYPVTGSSFQEFEVSGDCFVSGGKWTHPLSVNLDNNGTVHEIEQLRAKYTYRLSVKVGGDFVLGQGAKVDLTAKGHSQKRRTNNVCNLTPAHGGRFSGSTVGCYGNVKYPEDIGYASNAGTDGLGKCAAGGGAFKLTVGKKTVIDGEVSVNGEASSGNMTAGAAGSVLIEAADISGHGKVYAKGVSCGNTSYSNGCGGRIALIATGTLDSSGLDVSAGSSNSNGKSGVAGTVFFKDSSKPNGVLYVRNPDDKTSNAAPNRGVIVNDEGDWTFDAVVLEGNAVINVVPDSSLTLVNGFSSVSAPGNAGRYSGIFYNGGKLDVGTGDQTFSGNWYFCPAKEFVFPGDLYLTAGAAIGFSTYWEGPALAGNVYPNDPWTVRFSVGGDMVMDVGTEVTAYSAGNCQNSGTQPEGMSIGNHGGRITATGITTDSVFRPRLGCLYQSNSYGYVKGAGVIDFSVAGSLTVNGTINAKGMSSTDSQKKLGGAGSINITAGSLKGVGGILATATETVQAGGRIAIRLTEEDADFTGFRGKISANGGGNASTSAGSVYLQSGNDRELGGVVRIDNGGYAGGFSTPVCATGYAADVYQDFSDAVLEVSAAGYAQITACDDSRAFTMRALKMAKPAKLDLNGRNFTVRMANVNGSKVSIGTYHAGDYPFDDLLVDSAGNGSLRVTGYGLWVFVQ